MAADRTECREIQTAAYTARHVGQHLVDTGGSVPVGHSMVLAVALLQNDVAAVHWPGGGECVWDGESWPCTDVKRAHEVAQLVNAMWPWAVAAGGDRP
jgi:hypothetical protein